MKNLVFRVEINSEGASNNPLRFADAPTLSSPALPSPRRGHTLTLIDDFVYMFGGRTEGVIHAVICI